MEKEVVHTFMQREQKDHLGWTGNKITGTKWCEWQHTHIYFILYKYIQTPSFIIYIQHLYDLIGRKSRKVLLMRLSSTATKPKRKAKWEGNFLLSENFLLIFPFLLMISFKLLWNSTSSERGIHSPSSFQMGLSVGKWVCFSGLLPGAKKNLCLLSH